MSRHAIKYAVFGLLRNDKGQILLLKRKNTNHYNDYFDLPAGHGEPNETMYEAVKREMSEEIGIQVETVELVHTAHYLSPESSADYLYLFFEIKSYAGTPTIMESDKCSELLWADPTQVSENIVPCTRSVLTHIQNNLRSSSFRA